MLHADWPYASATRLNNPAEIRQYLSSVAKELEPYVVNTFTATFATTVEFDCAVCGQKIIANTAGVEKNGEVFCLDVDCGARYSAVKEGEQFGFRLDASDVECPDCGEDIRIPTVKITSQFKFNCGKCGSQFEICPPIWEFRNTQQEQTLGPD